MSGEKNKNKYHGFSIMETIIAVFVFSLIMTTVVATFVSIVDASRKAKAVQRDIENARVAIEQMAKALRTSSILSETSSNIQIFDYSQNQCTEYDYDDISKKFRLRNANNSASIGESPVCVFSGDYIDVIEGSLAGASFDIVTSADTPPIIGKATIALKVCYNNICTGLKSNKLIIQTTISLRDYQEVSP